MKKPIIIALGVILFTALGVQTYMFYRLHQQVSELRSGNPFALHFKDDSLPNDEQGDKELRDTFQELQHMHNEMEQLLGDSFSRFQTHSGAGAFIKMPALDLKEEADRYIVSLDLPGADVSSLNVKLAGQGLFISVKTESSNDQNEGGKNQYHRRERIAGTYQRSLTLPGPVKESAMTTNYSNGVLTIAIPKA